MQCPTCPRGTPLRPVHPAARWLHTGGCRGTLGVPQPHQPPGHLAPPSDPRGSPAPHSGEHPNKPLTPFAPEPPSTPHREPAPHPPSSPHPPIPPGSHLGARCPRAPHFPPRPPPRSPLRNAPGAGRGGRSAAAAAVSGAPAGYGGGHTVGAVSRPCRALPCPTVPCPGSAALCSPPGGEDGLSPVALGGAGGGGSRDVRAPPALGAAPRLLLKGISDEPRPPQPSQGG